jgi:hypothetical protein
MKGAGPTTECCSNFPVFEFETLFAGFGVSIGESSG